MKQSIKIFWLRLQNKFWSAIFWLGIAGAMACIFLTPYYLVIHWDGLKAGIYFFGDYVALAILVIGDIKGEVSARKLRAIEQEHLMVI
jgi:hypothetical protein